MQAGSEPVADTVSRVNSLPPPTPPTDLPPPASQGPTRVGKARRRPIAFAALALIVLRAGRSALGQNFGTAGAVGGLVLFLGLIFGWRLYVRQRARKAGVAEYTPEMVRKQFARSGLAAAAFPPDGTLLGSPVLMVNQRSKLVEVQTEYDLFDADGQVIGHVAQVGQGGFKKFVRFVGSLDQFFTHHFEVTDVHGVVVLRVTRPAKLFKSKVEVYDGGNRLIGRIIQDNVFGKIRFYLYDAKNNGLARLLAENWRAWDFRIELPSGVEMARITKTWEGLARTVFTNADTYVVRVHQRMGEPLRSLVFATALTVDLALKQDARGLGG